MSSQPELDVALLTAARDGKLEEIRSLLDRGANVNAVGDLKCTPLHLASFYGHHQCVELLIDRGADISIKDVREDGRDSLLPLLLISTISHPIHSILSATAKPQNKLPIHERLLN